MTTSVYLYRGAPIFPLTTIVSDGTLSCFGRGPMLAGDNGLIAPYLATVGPFAGDWFVAKKPVMDFSVGTTRVEGGCLRVLLDLTSNGGGVIVWREFFIAGGNGADQMVFTVEHGLVVPSWQMQMRYFNFGAMGAALTLFVEMRAV